MMIYGIYIYRVICRFDLELCIYLYLYLGLCYRRDLEFFYFFFFVFCDKFEYFWYIKMLLRGKINLECKFVIML